MHTKYFAFVKVFASKISYPRHSRKNNQRPFCNFTDWINWIDIKIKPRNFCNTGLLYRHKLLKNS